MTSVTTSRRRRPAFSVAMASLALTVGTPVAQAQTLLEALQSMRAVSVSVPLPVESAAGAPMAQPAPILAPAKLAEVRSEAEKGALARFIAAEYKTTRDLAARIVNAAYAAGARYQLQPSLLLAIISRESTFNPRATSGYGAQGLMQVVPRFHMDKLQEVRATYAQASLYHPETNIDVGARILAEYIGAESSLQRGLSKYSGRASRYFEKVMAEHDAFERVRNEAEKADGDSA
ncbi:transglycosylase SLT domain-containing protein [uncultured Azohydromonas sp.]|jgi:Soluble lytic murein transglycosylase and related regulatory proteins (some contain LysM/invasin domains)|uniref:transglycosylase SLT domain-containing protein n=1 Tax=uncultured Azohydromonas sp. TaxID=487342 RepID=UPI00263860F8|nr:transglycosylase SLT domain-containing protein [uncultured Azohydromonas sp.]